MFRKTLICLAISSPFSANAVVCTDPTGLGQLISQSAQDALIWAEEKGLDLTKISLDEAIAKWKDSQDTMREMAAVQAVSNTTSSTANKEQQAKMQPSPLLCDGINAVASMYQAVDDFYCSGQIEALDFSTQIADEVECDPQTGRCDTPTQSLADESVKLLEQATIGSDVDVTQFSVLGVVPGFSEGGYSKSESEKDRTDTLLKVLFSGGDVNKMPRGADGQLIDENSSPSAKSAYNEWLKDHLRTQTGYNAALRVNGLSNPRDENGRPTQSVLEQLKADIDYYNSPEQIKRYGNGGDKSCYTNKIAVFQTQAEIDQWLATPAGIACMNQFTTPEQVTRMNAQINARILNTLGFLIDSSLSSEFQLALQTQILNELNSK